MFHRRFLEARAKSRAARAFFSFPIARGAMSSALALAILSAPARAQTPDQQPAAQTTDQKLEQLQQKVDALDQAVKVAQRKQELAEEAAAEKAKTEATVTADTSGFTIRSPGGNYLLKIGADLQLDNRTYLGTGAGSAIDTLVARRVRPTFSGTIYHYIDFMFRPDFGQGTTAIYDAYAQLNYLPWANLRVGKFKPPVGLERLQSDDDTTFNERGLPSDLGPQRDIGYQLSADLFKKRANYAVGVFNGVPDASIGTDLAVSDHRDYSARIFLTPFLPDENALSGLGVGFGASGGNTDGEALPAFKTFGQQTFSPSLPASPRPATEPGSIRKLITTSGRSACWPNTRSTRKAFRKAVSAAKSPSALTSWKCLTSSLARKRVTPVPPPGNPSIRCTAAGELGNWPPVWATGRPRRAFTITAWRVRPLRRATCMSGWVA
jgi:phosphate-selective porin OprO/OprP